MNSAQCWHLDSGKRHCFPNAWISAFQLFHVFFRVFPCFSRFRNLQRNGFLPDVAMSQRSFPAQQAETSTDLLHRGVTRTHRPVLQVYHKTMNEDEWKWMKMNENQSCSEKFWPGSYDKLLIRYVSCVIRITSKLQDRELRELSWSHGYLPKLPWSGGRARSGTLRTLQTERSGFAWTESDLQWLASETLKLAKNLKILKNSWRIRGEIVESPGAKWRDSLQRGCDFWFQAENLQTQFDTPEAAGVPEAPGTWHSWILWQSAVLQCCNLLPTCYA